MSSSIKTDYDLDAAAFNATPEEVTSSTPGTQAIAIASLLTLKTSLWGLGPMYSFKAGAVKGFQHGDINENTPVAIEIFDSNGHDSDTVIIKGTQGEIDSPFLTSGLGFRESWNRPEKERHSRTGTGRMGRRLDLDGH